MVHRWYRSGSSASHGSNTLQYALSIDDILSTHCIASLSIVLGKVTDQGLTRDIFPASTNFNRLRSYAHVRIESSDRDVSLSDSIDSDLVHRIVRQRV